MKKICSRCKIGKDGNLKNFINRPKNNDGLSGQCRECDCTISHELKNIHLDHIVPLSKGAKVA